METTNSVQPSISGTCSPEFESVRHEFEQNFAARGEVGASVSVVVDGETVVDLWGGTKDQSAGAPWQADTVSLVWSCTKGATDLCAHILADRGQLDLDAPVAKYWPEFATLDGPDLKVWELLAHRAGRPAFRTPIDLGSFYEWDLMCDTIAQEEPWWEPGSRHGYHALTFGWLVGELVRRASGMPFEQFFRDNISGPLDLDFWIGLPEAASSRVAPMIAPDAPAHGAPVGPFGRSLATDPKSLQSLMMTNTGGYLEGGGFDTPEAHAAVIPANGGVTNARALARMYAVLACGGALGDVRLVGRDTLARMARVVSAGRDASLLIPTRFSAGFMSSMDNRREPDGAQETILIGRGAFGHSGAGGSIGFADPAARMSFAYTMNKMGSHGFLNPRGQELVDAVYRTLGYASNASGEWV